MARLRLQFFRDSLDLHPRVDAVSPARGRTSGRSHYSITDSTANNRINGNVIAINDNVVTSWNPTYSYDPLNRLSGFTASSYGNTYSYDV